jgi:hypothetical protein
LEVLVHFELSLDELPESFTLLRVEMPKSVGIRDVRGSLPPGWSNHLALTRRLGDTWLKEADTLLMRVRTVTVPHNCNYLFNTLHTDADRVELTHFAFPLDPRLFPGQD